ncbi:hypothetical protein GCM10010503_09780 [Streptomyces lucensis JCM 4490]|uniref:DUF397 domain-containing protein n=1 Tax=Streptomyces lucensis JCM 4490 TaxID=1306176 RepID=A0A918MMC3_9ACTN|nr:DUF397 domain-containing protein [Streptomyces lucensis]GGW35993.1 hypothetical protein GCM10010503_09780 [Streptomyces lucensis JCM 4490]
MTAPSEQQWFKSSYSGGSGTECVECAYVRDRTLVRDSKCQGDSPIGVRAQTWQAFTHALKRGDLALR